MPRSLPKLAFAAGLALVAFAPCGAAAAAGPDHILAFSWQPAFCETHRNKAECRSLTAERFDASNFSLHGLWPQPRKREYCGVAEDLRKLDEEGRKYLALPAIEISQSARAELDKVMPGTRSGLERHEWLRHGVCFSDSQQTYFAASLALMRALNASPVRALFAENVGNTIEATAIRAAFDEAFGEGAGERIRISCAKDDDRLLIVEMTLGLTGEIASEPDLARLIAAAPPTRPGCGGGLVDAADLQ